ncbi:MAG: ROK family protein [Oscillospiraceae bacterium]|nr:ROK family protein [Oscillospiraceae bacterium]
MKHYIGIDLGGTNIAAGLVTETGEMHYQCSTPTGANRATDEILADMAAVASLCRRSAGLAPEDICSIGIGVPGAVNDALGKVYFTANLDWEDLPLSRLMRERTGIETHLANDADCAALGEVIAGGAAGYDSAVMVTIGTGIGGGFIADRKIFRGWSGVGTEPGHMPLIYGGELCGCGCRGCFETYASATALIRQTRNAMRAHPDSLLWEVCPELGLVNAKTPFDAALRGDEVSIRLLDQYEEYLAAGIGGIINLSRPHCVIIGGGVSNQGETLLAPLREKLKKYCYASKYITPPPVIKAQLGNDAGIIGAALQAL